MNKQGSVLIFSLIFMLAMAALALTLSYLFLNEIKISRDLGEAIKAYYAAETGIERSLETIKTNRENGTNLSETITAIDAYGETLDNQARYEIIQAAASVSAITFKNLQPFETKQLDLYDSDTLSPISATTVSLRWQDSCQLEAVLSEWLPSSWPGEGASENRFYLNSPSATVGLTSGYNHWLRLRPLDCSISQLTVSLDVDSIPGFIAFTSQGEFSQVRQALQALLPWRASAFDLADWSLFSEMDIVK